MIDASAGVVLPPKEKSALPPTTACIVGAWFGNGPSHSTLMPSLASSLSNSPRSFAMRLRPERPQVSRTTSVVRPVAARAPAPRSSPAIAPRPKAAAPRKLRRDDEKSDILKPFRKNSGSNVRGDAKLGEQIATRNRSGRIGPVFKRNGAMAHHEDAIRKHD